MARDGEVTGKKPMSGHKVSHANNKTKRKFLPNLHEKRFWVPSEGRFIRLRVSARAMKTIDKLGIDKVLSDLKEEVNPGGFPRLSLHLPDLPNSEVRILHEQGGVDDLPGV